MEWATMSESALQSAVTAAAKEHGWLWYHPNRSHHDKPGFPDLVLVRPPWVLFVELKAEDGRLSPTQAEWADALSQCHKTASAVVGPSGMDSLLAVLARPV